MRALKIITTAALATVALTGCVFVPAMTATVVEDTPQPTNAAAPLTAEDRYLEAVMDGITHESIPGNVEDMIVEMGHLTCDAWDEGYDYRTVEYRQHEEERVNPYRKADQ